MSEYPEFKHTSLLMSEGEQLSDVHQRIRWNTLQKQCDQYKASVEFHERNAKIMEQALLSAEKKADSRIQRINQLENRLDRIKDCLGSLSYVVDYPDEESASIVEDLCRDAERYRFIRIRDDAYHLHAIICYRNSKSLTQCFVDGKQADAVIDSLMLEKSPGVADG